MNSVGIKHMIEVRHSGASRGIHRKRPDEFYLYFQRLNMTGGNRLMAYSEQVRKYFKILKIGTKENVSNTWCLIFIIWFDCSMSISLMISGDSPAQTSKELIAMKIKMMIHSIFTINDKCTHN